MSLQPLSCTCTLKMKLAQILLTQLGLLQVQSDLTEIADVIQIYSQAKSAHNRTSSEPLWPKGVHNEEVTTTVSGPAAVPD